MRRLLLTVLVLLSGGEAASAQNVFQRYNLNVAGAQPSVATSADMHKMLWVPVGSLGACTVALDRSADAITWTSGGIITAQDCTTPGELVSSQTVTNYVRVNVTSLTGSGSLSVAYVGWQQLGSGSGSSVSVTNFPATQPVSGTVTVTQPTGTNLHTVCDSGCSGSGTVSVSNFPATQPVSGSVSVSNFPATQPVSGTFFQATQPVSIASMPSTPVTGTFFQATQPVSIASMPTTPVSGSVSVSNFPASQAVTGTFFQATQPVSLSSVPTHAVTQSGTWASQLLDSGGTNKASVSSGGALKVDNSAVTQPISGSISVSNFPATQPISGSVSVSNFPATQPVSASSLPLPAGAATSAKQPALGVAGTPSTDVISVQGIASMTALKTDGSGVTQPVSGSVSVSNFPATQPISGTVTANIGTTNGLALDATLTGGTQKTKLVDTGGTNVASVSATGALKVDGSAVTQPVSGAFFQATQPVSLTTLPALTAGSAVIGHVINDASSATIGGVNPVPTSTSATAISASSKSALTTSVNVKASPGNVFGLFALNGAASTCWVELINSAGAGTLGTGVIFSVPLPASTTTPVWITLPFPVNFSTGIAVGIATTNGGASACGTAGNAVVFFL